MSLAETGNFIITPGQAGVSTVTLDLRHYGIGIMEPCEECRVQKLLHSHKS